VVFVHGASVAAPSWADLVARLGGFRCLLLDRPGCGLSDPLPRRLDVPDFLDVADRLVPDLLDALHIETASIVATSLGGMFAVRAAATSPDRVERMVLFGWTLGTPAAPAPFALRLASRPTLGRLAAVMPASRRSVTSMLRSVGLRRAVDEGHLSEAAIDWLVALYRNTDTLRHELVDGPKLLSLRGWDPRLVHDARLLAGIQARTCIVHGTDDPFGSITAARHLADAIPSARLHVLERAGHAPWLEETDRAVAITEQFLRHDVNDS
jgi:pimeloyl-ACP methyl ester carboxylesterase